MPYFSFSIKSNIDKILHFLGDNNINLEINTKYYSKNSKIYKLFNNRKYYNLIENIQYEKREKIKLIGKKILICLPPSIGLGDSVEYALFSKALVESNLFDKVGIAYVDRFKIIFKKFFNLSNIYPNFISQTELNTYDTIFHVTLEINQLKNQKYSREDIEGALTHYFNIKKFRKKITKNYNKINKITIFPISESPLRTLNDKLINNLVRKFNNYSFDIILDRSSEISNYLDKLISSDNINKIYPENLIDLIKEIEKVEFGIFPDSGPLHLAKILGIRGILLTTTVNGKKLLNGFNSIEEFLNNYQSNYCSAPCGLTNIFNYNNSIGCYDSLKIKKNEILNLKSFNKLQRGSLKKNYINFIDNPVGCHDNIDVKSLYKHLIEKLNNYGSRNS
ncbi:MAG: hypothetical protein CFH18_00404 [Alphaproteobacteria bacterium MarineAlpha5_Bin8]|nr:MAG: hypothetical protein CFH17_00121 [Alphaproteobacteria bacterium MarineAlpha5_Bin7]PPR47396.1 MAG: hypothetical protein CFH18_00404 [Alphaproteobacteria bacterium MarineAlpha5_Bin8]PPR54937.1 MAG: hypothetical protein CFH16_00114 [Alphaproteobacteria bacterium MarineAlpha5_Bin6]|tara:strand:+ start:1478 stop:2653 length:1176 start_codon:yes stop_codon:yes gene_type:complete